jgi:DNA-directed RNA polymerase specialized sigma24 family protein
MPVPTRRATAARYHQEAMAPPAGAGTGHDPLLAPFLECPDEEARARLSDLLERHASPLVRDIVRGQVPDRAGGVADAADVHSGVMLRLTAHLWALRSEASAEPLASFAGYVAAAAHNACHAFFRSRYPQRSRLRNKLRYVLTREPRLALWTTDRHVWVAGRAAWRGRGSEPAAGERLVEAGARLSPRPFAELVEALVDLAGGPCRLDLLADAVARVLGVSDEWVSLSEDGDAAPSLETRLADPAPAPGEQIDNRRYLERLWIEICDLPEHQRAALLLNLRDDGGGGMLGLLPLTGIASQERIAQVVGFPPDRLAELWPRLPVDDEWIAGELGVSRRQVINFRKCARERLARRMRKAGVDEKREVRGITASRSDSAPVLRG